MYKTLCTYLDGFTLESITDIELVVQCIVVYAKGHSRHMLLMHCIEIRANTDSSSGAH